MIKQLPSIETNQVALEVFECQCGFHLGLDATYLDQVGDVCLPCPSCGVYIDTEIIDRERVEGRTRSCSR